MDKKQILERATGGQDAIVDDDDLMPASGVRSLIFDDPGLLWLQHHGEGEGFQQDSGRYRLLPFLSKLGAEFEAAFIRHEAPHAVRLLQHCGEVRKKNLSKKPWSISKRELNFYGRPHYGGNRRKSMGLQMALSTRHGCINAIRT